jgi:hypothetical protein
MAGRAMSEICFMRFPFRRPSSRSVRDGQRLPDVCFLALRNVTLGREITHAPRRYHKCGAAPYGSAQVISKALQAAFSAGKPAG